MKKIIFTLSIVLMIIFFPFISNSQTNYEDVVYLNDGSIIHGMIVEQIPNEIIKIKTKDGNIFVYKIAEIEKMTKEPIQESIKRSSTSLDYDIKQSGYTAIIEANYGFGTGPFHGTSSWGVSVINGYLFNPYFSAGVGIGVDKYSGSIFLPLFANLRLNFLENIVTPFVSMSSGYSLGFTGQSGNYGDNTGGFMLNPSLGIKIFVPLKFSVNIALGYRLQRYISRYDYDYSISPYDPIKTPVFGDMNFVNLKFGVAF